MSNTKPPTPPQDLDAERSVLGAVLESREALADVAELLEPSDFYHPAHQATWAGVLELFGKGEPVDAITLANHLKSKPDEGPGDTKANVLEKVGGRPFLVDLIGAYPTASAAPRYATLVREMATRRRLIITAHRITELAHSSADVNDAIERADSLLFGARGRTITAEPKGMAQLLHEMFENLEHRSEHDLVGVDTGFFRLNRMTGGLQGGQLWIVAARPSMGKSSLLIDLTGAAAKAGAGVLFFSVEMSDGELIERYASSAANVASHLLRSGNLDDRQMNRLSTAAGRLSELPIKVLDAAHLTLTELRARCRRAKNLGLVVIDYLQLMRHPGHEENRQQEVSEISRGLKLLARELNVPVVAASQLNRNVEYRPDKRPRLGDLRESGSLEQDADLVLMLYRDEVYEPKPENAGKAELIIAKQRNGPIGMVPLQFIREFTRFATPRGDDVEQAALDTSA